MMLLLNLYKKLSRSSCLLSSRGGSYASMCSDSTGDVLKAIVYILISYLHMKFLISLGKLCYIVSKHSPSLIYIIHCTVLRFSPHFLPAITLIVFKTSFTFTFTLSICFSQFNLLSRELSTFLVGYDLFS